MRKGAVRQVILTYGAIVVVRACKTRGFLIPGGGQGYRWLFGPMKLVAGEMWARNISKSVSNPVL